MTILLLDIPGLHLGYLGCYGNDWVATPNLDRLASEAVVFDAHYLGRPGDLRSGQRAFPRPGQPLGESPPRPWFAENNAANTIDVIEPGDPALPLDERFSQMLHAIAAALKKPRAQLIWAVLPSLAPPWKLPIDLLEPYFDDTGEVDQAADEEPEAESESEEPQESEESEEQGPPLEPWPDPPAQLPEGDDAFDRLQFTYAAVVTFVDAQIGALLDRLRARGQLDRLLLVITASEALPLGEHGWIGRQRAWQHEEAVHVPLLLRLPKAELAGLRIAALTQSIDVVPTLLDYLGLSSDALEGRSLRPLIAQEVSEVHTHLASEDCVGDSVEWSLRTREWAFLLPLAAPQGDPARPPQLYVKPDDRWEVNNVYQHHPALADELEKTLRAVADLGRLCGSARLRDPEASARDSDVHG